MLKTQKSPVSVISAGVGACQVEIWTQKYWTELKIAALMLEKQATKK